MTRDGFYLLGSFVAEADLLVVHVGAAGDVRIRV